MPMTPDMMQSMSQGQMMGTGSNGLDGEQLPQSGPNPEMGAHEPPPNPMGEAPEMPGQENDQAKDNLTNLLDYMVSDLNIARQMKDDKVKGGDTLVLDQIGEDIVEGFLLDEESRRPWMEQNEEWLNLALLVREDKSFPWPKASNVKYPLLATAAMQFSARAYPALVPSDGKVVKAKVIPYDPTGELGKKAERIAKHMSYQVMCKMPNWEEEMDKLLMTMAISGICFKKTYKDGVTGQKVSQLVYPENFVVNYNAKSLDKAYRKTEILFYTENELQEKIRNNEEFLDVELGEPMIQVQDPKPPLQTTQQSKVDASTPHRFLACHTYYDLDGDGYEEPVIVTVHQATKKVVRIIARWDQAGVKKNAKDETVSIQPVEYFTSFPFIPNPDGSIYALGFGALLGPLNESVNTLINQLTDSGTLSNLQAGFIGKGLRLKIGPSSFAPGEWKAVNATADDLRKQIVPLPVNAPSPVLMNLLQMLITSGNQLASIAEIFVGKMPGQNTPATTTQETVKQGMAVFTAIYKRVYRALQQEFEKIYRLNRIDKETAAEEARTVGVQLDQSDYDEDGYIKPGADPTGDSQADKMQKVQVVGQLLALRTIDPMAYTTWALESNEVPNFQKLLAQPQQPQPSPEEKKAQMEMQVMQQKAQADQQAAAQKLDLQRQLADIKLEAEKAKIELEKTKQAMELQGQKMQMMMDQVSHAQQMKHEAQTTQQDMMKSHVENQMDLNQQAQQNQMQLKTAEATHSQKLQQGEQSFQAKQKQAKATQKVAKKPK